MDIDTLEGRELDAAVSEARGIHTAIRMHPHWLNEELVEARVVGGGHKSIPSYYSDIAAAMTLWKELRAGGLETYVYEEGNGLMSFSVRRGTCQECGRHEELSLGYFHELDELPTAISRAYLKAKEAQ